MVMCCYGGVLVWWCVVMLVCRVLVWWCVGSVVCCYVGM